MQQYLDDEDIEIIAKGLYALAVRSGPIETYHAQGQPIGNKEMEVINRYAYNVICQLVKWLFSAESENFGHVCEFASHFLCYFDPPDYESDEVKGLNAMLHRIKKHRSQIMKEENDNENGIPS